ncbi:MAG: hypothetical protein V7L20_09975 [Nostoc sp.]|uniref:hypothetical protein n=1 Tax=Nostoc sp. TaxID=1180 RepID=UPI002FFB0B8C
MGYTGLRAARIKNKGMRFTQILNDKSSFIEEMEIVFDRAVIFLHRVAEPMRDSQSGCKIVIDNAKVR